MLKNLLLSVAFLLLLTVPAQSGLVDLSLEPAVTTGVGVGDIVQLDLWARSPQVENVVAVQTYIQYDSNLLQVVDAGGNPADKIDWAGWDLELFNDVGDPPHDGNIYFSAVSFGGRQTDFTAASVHMKVLQSFGSTSILLVAGPVEPLSYQTKVTAGFEDVTGELAGATIRGAQPDRIPEPLSLTLLGIPLAVLVRRRRHRQ